MKTIYIQKVGQGYVEYPVPYDLENYHTAQVPDDFVYTGGVYNPETNTFSPNTDALNAQIELQRWEQYRLRVDPLTMEATLKQNIGLQDEAGALFQQAYAKRLLIQNELPYV